MNMQDEQQPDNQQSVIEDLTVNEDRATEVKGGASGDGSVRSVKDSVAIRL